MSEYPGNRFYVTGYDCLGMNSLFRIPLIAVFCCLFWPFGANSNCESDRNENGPKLIRQVLPEFPPLAIKKKLSGSVTLALTVDGGGILVGKVDAWGAQPLFNSAALAAARQWRFGAANDPVNSHYYFKWYRLTFTLQGKTGLVQAAEDASAPLRDDVLESPKATLQIEPKLKDQTITTDWIFADIELDCSPVVLNAVILRPVDAKFIPYALSALRRWRYSKLPDCKPTDCRQHKNVRIMPHYF